MDKGHVLKNPRQTPVLFKYWMRGEKGKSFLRHSIQDTLLVSTLFLTSTILVNFNFVFSHIVALLRAGNSVSLSGVGVQITNPYQVDWSAISVTNLPMTQSVLPLVAEISSGMFYASIIIISYFILRDAWASFNRTKLTFSFLKPSIRGVMHHGCSRVSVQRFVFLSSALQAFFSYAFGIALTIFVIFPVLAFLLQRTFFTFLVSAIPALPYYLVAIPVIINFVLNVGYFRYKV
jgi:hypothetical protein